MVVLKTLPHFLAVRVAALLAIILVPVEPPVRVTQVVAAALMWLVA